MITRLINFPTMHRDIFFPRRENEFITPRRCITERDNDGGAIRTRICMQYITISYGWVSTRPLQLGLETKRQRKHAKCSTITLVTPPWQPIAIFRMCCFGTKKCLLTGEDRCMRSRTTIMTTCRPGTDIHHFNRL